MQEKEEQNKICHSILNELICEIFSIYNYESQKKETKKENEEKALFLSDFIKHNNQKIFKEF